NNYEKPIYCFTRSYFSTCSCLSDRKQFPTFFRVVPNDDYQVKAIAQLLKRFDWTWIGMVTEDDDYGRFALQGLKREIENTNICLAYHEMIPKDYTQEQVLKILKVMKESTAKVVVVFSGEGGFYPFLREFVTQNITGMEWIASEAWVTASMLAESYPFLDGTIGFAIHQGYIPGLQNYLKTVTPERYPSNPQVQELWEALYGCFPSTTSLNKKVNFDVKGDSIPSYDLINWQRLSSGDIQFVKVGIYDGAQQAGRELLIVEQAIMWSHLQNKARCSIKNTVTM
uniref:Receptor ligand binding region domain-containing protein n=1 Tax=Sinocyclocheilus anshuiensis TaxID=1608454 RepID=A0A671QHQ8_9TELE